MHRVSFWSISQCLNLFLIVVCLSPSIVLSVKRWISKSYSSNMQKMLETWRFRRTWRIILKNSSQFNCSEQTRDSWTKITKEKNSCRSFRLPHKLDWSCVDYLCLCASNVQCETGLKCSEFIEICCSQMPLCLTEMPTKLGCQERVRMFLQSQFDLKVQCLSLSIESVFVWVWKWNRVT